jgi:hypothetical protein
MPHYTLYKPDTGEVILQLDCSEEELPLNLAHYPGLSHVEGWINGFTHDVVNGQPVPHTRRAFFER